MFNLLVGMLLLWCLVYNEYNRIVYNEGGLRWSLVLGTVCFLNLGIALGGLL